MPVPLKLSQKKWFWMLLVVLAAGPGWISGQVQILPQTNIQLSSNELFQGDLVLITITSTQDAFPRLEWLKKEIPLFPNLDQTKWFGFLTAGLEAHPGDYRARVSLSLNEQTKSIDMDITLKAKDYGLRNLTLPKEMVDLDEPTLERVRKENAVLAAIWHAPLSEVFWKGSFIRPVPGEVSGIFGLKSMINDQPRAPHSGVDLRGEKGTPIKAVQNGRVVLVAEHFFTGNTVVIDHGGNIQSIYCHQDQVLVEEGQFVKQGDVIGLIGSTGRATGPHLHFGMRVNHTTVHPLHVIQLSESIRE